MTACIPIPSLRPAQPLTLPGGVRLEQPELLRVAQPALAPLVPLFDVVDTVIAVFDCIKAIPAMFGPPPDPTLLGPALEKLADKTMKLMRLVPQLSVPYTILDIVDLVIGELRAAQQQLHHLQARLRQMDRALTRAAELHDEELTAIVECSQANVAREAANVGAGLAGVGKLLQLASTLLELIGAPALPPLTSLGGQTIDVVIELLDVLVDGLVLVRREIPLR